MIFDPLAKMLKRLSGPYKKHKNNYQERILDVEQSNFITLICSAADARCNKGNATSRLDDGGKRWNHMPTPWITFVPKLALLRTYLLV